MTESGTQPIPAFVNARSGTAREAAAALTAAGSRFALHLIDPERLAEEIAGAVAAGARRVAVAGGDGTVETAAAVLAGSPVELAVIPGGTLNHFARDHGIPKKLTDAIAVAAEGCAEGTDVGVVNKRIFVNTSSVGAYIDFVQVRDRLKRYFGYHVATLLAALRMLVHLRRFSVHLTLAGEDRVYETPLVFVGVGERSLGPPELGGRVPGGHRALHVMVAGHAREARRWTRAYHRAQRGRVLRESEGPLLDSFLVDACRVEMPRPRGNVAVDGEIVAMMAPLGYRLWRDALLVVVPRGQGQGRDPT